MLSGSRYPGLIYKCRLQIKFRSQIQILTYLPSFLSKLQSGWDFYFDDLFILLNIEPFWHKEHNRLLNLFYYMNDYIALWKSHFSFQTLLFLCPRSTTNKTFLYSHSNYNVLPPLFKPLLIDKAIYPHYFHFFISLKTICLCWYF